jgi:hypothetical protein
MIIGATVNVQDEITAILAFLVAKNNKAKNMKLEINALNNRINRTLCVVFSVTRKFMIE